MAEASPATAPLVITPPAAVPAAGTIASPVGVTPVAPAVATAAITAAAASTAFTMAIPAAAVAPTAAAAPVTAVAATASCGGVITSGGAPWGGDAGPSVRNVTDGGHVGCYPATTRPTGYHRDVPTAAPTPARAAPTAPRSGKAASDGNYQLLYAREVYDDTHSHPKPNPNPNPNPDPNPDPNPNPNPNPNQVHDDALAPRHPGDHTPRLLIERLRPSEGGSSGVGGGGGVGGVVGRGGGAGDESEFVTGRLLLSPWSAFKGVLRLSTSYCFLHAIHY